MPVDGVNKVAQDGRFKLPPELAQKYKGEYLSVSEEETGELRLQVVDHE